MLIDFTVECSDHGLFGHGEIEPGEKIDALHPLPTGETSILYPL